MNRSQALFFVLGGFFITNALIAELIGGKLFTSSMPQIFQSLFQSVGWDVRSFTMSVGILPWPIVFVATDLVNEFFGRRGVRFFTFITMGLILYTLVVLQLAVWVPTAGFSPVDQESFVLVFGTSQRIILASLVAFGVSQLVDALVFSKVRSRTAGAHLWARATGSTVVSQFVDTFLIQFLAFYLPGYISLSQYVEVSSVSYLYKVGVAIAITPLCYIGHAAIRKYLGQSEAYSLIEKAHS